MSTAHRPDPAITTTRGAIAPRSFSMPYWEATRERRLLLQFCREAGRFQFFPRPVSIYSGRLTLEWREVDGRGHVYSLTRTHVGLGPFKGSEPYMVITARLDAGVDIVSNIAGCDPDSVTIGMRLKPYWLPLDDGRHLLLFQPDTGDGR